MCVELSLSLADEKEHRHCFRGFDLVRRRFGSRVELQVLSLVVRVCDIWNRQRTLHTHFPVQYVIKTVSIALFAPFSPLRLGQIRSNVYMSRCPDKR